MVEAQLCLQIKEEKSENNFDAKTFGQLGQVCYKHYVDSIHDLCIVFAPSDVLHSTRHPSSRVKTPLSLLLASLSSLIPPSICPRDVRHLSLVLVRLPN